MIEVVHGLRSCDGDTARCAATLALGGWGTAVAGGEELIPNKNVAIVNNVVFNPEDRASQWQHLTVAGRPVDPPAEPPADTVRPTVRGVVPPVAGSYRPGAVLTFAVRFSEPVAVTGGRGCPSWSGGWCNGRSTCRAAAPTGSCSAGP
ncbi:MAG: hypothetical protein FJ284_00675 [Planctomycetes bacterium]|nr:hypothetical protein [Planctomycetota bacterium]